MPSVSLPLLKAWIRPTNLQHPAKTTPATAGIKPYGAGVSATVQAQAGFKLVFTVQAQAGIQSSTPTVPLNPVAAHAGSGAVIFNWSPPASGSVRHYEIWGSTSLNGSYSLLQGTEIIGNRAIITNLPIGILLYFKIRAISTADIAGPFAQFKKGTIARPVFPVEIRAIKGSKILAGTMFSILDEKSGRIIAISAVNDIDITCP
jgi:hypothetical protein